MNRNRGEAVDRVSSFARHRHWRILFSAVLLSWSTTAAAQRVRITGVVRDSSGAPIPEVDVSIPADHLITRSNKDGIFSIDHVPVGTARLSARRLGYDPESFDIPVGNGSSDTVRVVMRVQPQILAGMDVSAQEMRRRVAIEDFYRRSVRGQGNYITREDLEARHASRLSDALRGVPGLTLTRNGWHGGMSVRFSNASFIRHDCVPQYWLDGVRVDDVEIDDLPPSTIEGIELYQGPSTTPLQFSSQGSTVKCGAVVIWTRVPGT